MSAPLVVNTSDGTVWKRRGALRGGEALYAPEGVCSCPESVMATLAELAEHGIAGSADVLPVPMGDGQQLKTEQRAAIRELIGDAKPATDLLLEQLAESIRDRREHEHPTWEDLYCLNLTSYMGERMGPVLRRLLNAEARVAELEAQLAAKDRPADEDPIRYALTAKAEESADKLTRLLAPTQALREDDPFGLHHTYRVPRDLPAGGGR